jgi:hypothetical protein
VQPIVVRPASNARLTSSNRGFAVPFEDMNSFFASFHEHAAPPRLRSSGPLLFRDGHPTWALRQNNSTMYDLAGDAPHRRRGGRPRSETAAAVGRAGSQRLLPTLHAIDSVARRMRAASGAEDVDESAPAPAPSTALPPPVAADAAPEAPAPQTAAAVALASPQPSQESNFDRDMRDALQLSLIQSARGSEDTPLRRFDPSVCPPNVDPDVFFSLPPEDREEILVALLQSEQPAVSAPATAAPATSASAGTAPSVPAESPAIPPMLISADAMAMMFQLMAPPVEAALVPIPAEAAHAAAASLAVVASDSAIQAALPPPPAEAVLSSDAPADVVPSDAAADVQPPTMRRVSTIARTAAGLLPAMDVQTLAEMPAEILHEMIDAELARQVRIALPVASLFDACINRCFVRSLFALFCECCFVCAASLTCPPSCAECPCCASRPRTANK